MSVLFGRWQFDGRTVDQQYLERMDSAVARYGPDGRGFHSIEGVTLGYRAFHTSPGTPCINPFVSESGVVVSWDGRLDNRQELIAELGGALQDSSTDIEAVAAAYSAWGLRCFGKLVGDWALVIWDSPHRTLLLGTDFVGARRLYYRLDRNQLCWSTILDPLVVRASRGLALSEEYLAEWMSGFPASGLTPFREIQAVEPGTYVSIHNREEVRRKYWDFDSGKTTRYRCDAEYEEHFRHLFAQAVRRRLFCNSPVLAELSGGMDSSSIVCMADKLLAQEPELAPRLDTVSYYSNSEPAWDDQQYFTLVEEKRGTTGCHIDVGSNDATELPKQLSGFAATPAAVLGASKSREEFAVYVHTQGSRVLLSGIGGDEVLGGVPTPIPELSDLLASGNVCSLLRRALEWASVQRKPLLHLLYETAREFLPSSSSQGPPDWLTSELAGKRNSAKGSTCRTRLFGSPASFQHNMRAVEVLRRQLGSSLLSPHPLLETRYPYLDRDLLEFLFSIPRDQIIRPGRRRSLMRRALIGIVPDEVLHRRRKAFVVRAPSLAISAFWARLTAKGTTLTSETLGLVDSNLLSASIHALEAGSGAQILQLSHTLILEIWLRQLEAAGHIRMTGELSAMSNVV